MTTEKLKKRIIIGYCAAMVVASVYVPWKVDRHTRFHSLVLDRGYSFVFSPPVPAATIYYGRVLLEFVTISAIAGLLYVISDRVVKR